MRASSIAITLIIASMATMATMTACIGTIENSTPESLTPEPCEPGAQEECQSIFPGVCAAGVKQCNSQGAWGQCRAMISPGMKSEDCANFLDDNCDGLTDGQDLQCVVPLDPKPGPETCVATAAQETGAYCDNGLDDDCDGIVDWNDPDCAACVAGVEQACSTAYHGVCRQGSHACSAQGQWNDCTPTIAPGSQTEDCANTLDDDCDSLVDGEDADCTSCTPGQSQTCPTIYLGACAAGTQTCTAEGHWGACQPLVSPGSQTEDVSTNRCANALDDDCDGLIDTADPGCFECSPFTTDPSCATGLSGICATGTRSCSAQGTWGGCAPRAAQTEVCNNGLDDDCDGLMDSADTTSGCCLPGTLGEVCSTSNPSICQPGHRLCTADNVMSTTCTPDIAPGSISESLLCQDGVDNDCDGQVDLADQEDCAVCTAGETHACILSGLSGLCASGQQTCTGGQWSDCQQIHFPQAEDCCSTQDLNCNGLDSNTDPVCNQCTPGISCVTNLTTPGCTTGIQECTTLGQCVRINGSCLPPTGNELADQCNGLDDNCNGQIDEGTTLSGDVKVMEFLPPAACQLLLGSAYPGYNHECMFFMNWSNGGMGRYMVSDITNNFRTIASGNAYSFFEARAPNLFSSADQVQRINSLVLLPTGSFNGAVSSDSLFFFSTVQEPASQRLRSLRLSDMTVGFDSIANVGAPGVTDTFTSAAYVKSTDLPTLTADVLVLTRGSMIYLYSDATGWMPPATINSWLVSSPPANFNLNTQLSGLTVYRSNGSALMGATSTNGYFGYMTFSNYGVWTSVPITNFSCAR